MQSSSCEPGCAECVRLRAAAVQLVGGEGVETLSWEALARSAAIDADEGRAHYDGDADACLLAGYAEVVDELFAAYEQAFSSGRTWEDGLDAATAVMLEQLAARPDYARLLFVEILRGGHAMRRQRDLTRRRCVELLAREHERRGPSAQLPAIQFEVLYGAYFQSVASQIADGRTEELPELKHKLLTLASVFEPIAA
jgi:hypothetical protein